MDQTDGTRPLWQELGNLDQAKSNYGAIVYNKAPAVLKQLEYLVGDYRVPDAASAAFSERHAYGNATWRDLLGAIATRREAGRSTDSAATSCCRPGMPVVEQRVAVARRQDSASRAVATDRRSLCRATRPWTERTEVLLAYRIVHRCGFRSSSEDPSPSSPRRPAAPAPDFVFANSRDFGYFLLLLDSASVSALEGGALGRTEDAFLRAMLWGALWDQVRNLRMTPERFVRLALRELPRETDEQIVPVVLLRLDRAVSAYLSPERSAQRPGGCRAGTVGRSGGRRRARTASGRRTSMPSSGSRASPDAHRGAHALLSADSAAGEPIRDPTRWDVVTRLLELDAPRAEHAAGGTESEGHHRGWTPSGVHCGARGGRARP